MGLSLADLYFSIRTLAVLFRSVVFLLPKEKRKNTAKETKAKESG
jgi:hypothetical protein